MFCESHLLNGPWMHHRKWRCSMATKWSCINIKLRSWRACGFSFSRFWIHAGIMYVTVMKSTPPESPWKWTETLLFIKIKSSIDSFPKQTNKTHRSEIDPAAAFYPSDNSVCVSWDLQCVSLNTGDKTVHFSAAAQLCFVRTARSRSWLRTFYRDILLNSDGETKSTTWPQWVRMSDVGVRTLSRGSVMVTQVTLVCQIPHLHDGRSAAERGSVGRCLL